MPDIPFKILAIEHVGIAVNSLDDLSNLFLNKLGLENTITEEVRDQKVITNIFNTGSGKLELLKATEPNSPISKFIDKKGEGIHHIALLIDNLSAAIKYLDNEGIKLIDAEPRIGAEGYSIAFIHPKSTGGILIELCEKNIH